MTRTMPRIGMRATVEGFAGRDEATIVSVEDDGRRVVVECAGERLVFTLRRLTGRYVRERDPYYGVRLRLVPLDPEAEAEPD